MGCGPSLSGLVVLLAAVAAPAARWDAGGAVPYVFDLPAGDWSAFDELHLELGCDRPAACWLVAESDNAATASGDLLRRRLVAGGANQRFELALGGFEPVGAPLGWRQIDRLLLVAAMPFERPQPGLWSIGAVELRRRPLLVNDLGWLAGDGPRRRLWRFQNRSAEPLRVRLRLRGKPAAGQVVGSLPEGVEVAPGGAEEVALGVEGAAGAMGDLAIECAPGPTVPVWAGSAAWLDLPSDRPAAWLTEATAERLRAGRDDPAQKVVWGRHQLVLDRVQEWWREAGPTGDGVNFPLDLAYDVYLQAVIEPDPAVLDAARGLLWRLAADPSLTTQPNAGYGSTGLYLAAGIALGYDSLGATLTPGERRRLRGIVVEQALQPYLSALEDGLRPSDRALSPTACADAASAVVVAAVLLGDDPRAPIWLAATVDELQRLLEALPEDGSWPAGLPDWQTAVGHLLWAVEVLACRTQGAVDLRRHRFFAATGDFVLHAWLPPAGLVQFGRSSRPVLLPDLLGKLSDNLARPDWRWLARRLTVGASPYSLLLGRPADDGLPPTSIAGCFPSAGWAVLRSDWSDEALVIALRAGPNDPQTHLDGGSLLVHFGGETLLPELPATRVDDDFWQPGGKSRYDWAATRGHNTLVIDGREQREDWTSRGLLAPTEGGVTADLTELYDGVEAVVRRLILRSDYALVIDRVRTSRPTILEWRANTAGEAVVAGHRARVRGDAQAIDLVFWSPAPVRVEPHHHPGGEPYLSVQPTEPTLDWTLATLLVPVREGRPAVEAALSEDGRFVEVRAGDTTERWSVVAEAADRPGPRPPHETRRRPHNRR